MEGVWEKSEKGKKAKRRQEKKVRIRWRVIPGFRERAIHLFEKRYGNFD